MASDIPTILMRFECVYPFILIFHGLFKIWSNRLDSQQLKDIIGDVKMMHKSMKRMIDIVFAVSPILVLSTHEWASRSIHGTYLFRVRNVDWFIFF